MSAQTEALRKLIAWREQGVEMPRHVAIIMDGNGRWAKERGLERTAGHREGTRAVKVVVKAASQLGLKVLTLYTFSEENWSRPVGEVASIMRLLRITILNELTELNANNVRVETIGRVERLPFAERKAVEHARRVTSRNTGMVLCLALSYGGREELTDAIRAIASEAAAHTLDPATIDRATIDAHLYTHALPCPDPDLIVRTSGEMRVSNFLLWQGSYAEWYFEPRYWPDFGEQELCAAIEDYLRRERRFGGTEADSPLRAVLDAPTPVTSPS